MADSLRLDTALLVAIVMQGLFYGIFLVLFSACCYVLVYKKKTSNINYPFLFVAITLFSLLTVNFAVSFSRIIDAFIVYQDVPNGPTVYLQNLTQWKEVFRTAVYVALTLVADSLFIYRLYIVWSRSLVIILVPLLLLCGSATGGIGATVMLATLTPGTSLFVSAISAWITSFFSVSLVQNVLTTALIVFRIWRVNMAVVGTRQAHNSLWPIIAVILESGALYSGTLFVFLMTYVSGSYSQYIMLDILTPVIGITFCLIIVRVGLGLIKTASGHQNNVSTMRPSYPLRKININVSRTVDLEGDDSREEGGRTRDEEMAEEPEYDSSSKGDVSL